MAELTREEGWLVRGGEDVVYTELCWSKEEVRAALKILLEEDFEHYFARFNDPDEWAGNEIMWRDWEIGYVAITKFTAFRALSAPAPQQSSLAADRAIVKLVHEIHQDLKRGSDTENHGLLGNLRCIQDAVLNILHPIPDPMAAGAVAPPEQQELIARLKNIEAGWIPGAGECFPITLLPNEREQIIEALSRSHEDGRRAGLEEAAVAVGHNIIRTQGDYQRGRYDAVRIIRALKK